MPYLLLPLVKVWPKRNPFLGWCNRCYRIYNGLSGYNRCPVEEGRQLPGLLVGTNCQRFIHLFFLYRIVPHPQHQLSIFPSPGELRQRKQVLNKEQRMRMDSKQLRLLRSLHPRSLHTTRFIPLLDERGSHWIGPRWSTKEDIFMLLHQLRKVKEIKVGLTPRILNGINLAK